MRPQKQKVYVWQFRHGYQGAKFLLGHVDRVVTSERRLMSTGRRMCASAQMIWQNVDTVDLGGVTYVALRQEYNDACGPVQGGDWVVDLASDDPAPRGLIRLTT